MNVSVANRTCVSAHFFTIMQVTENTGPAKNMTATSYLACD